MSRHINKHYLSKRYSLSRHVSSHVNCTWLIAFKGNTQSLQNTTFRLWFFYTFFEILKQSGYVCWQSVNFYIVDFEKSSKHLLWAFKEQSPKIEANKYLKLRKKLKYRRFLLNFGSYKCYLWIAWRCYFLCNMVFWFLKELWNHFLQKPTLSGKVSTKSRRNCAKSTLQSSSCFL